MATGIRFGSFLGSTSNVIMSTISNPSTFPSSSGSILASQFTIPEIDGPTGSGTLMSITFDAIGAGTTLLDMDEVGTLLVDVENDEFTPLVLLSTAVTVTDNTPTPTPTDIPTLSIETNIPAFYNQTVSVPIQFTANGQGIGSVIFSLDFDQSCLQFDASDGDGDGIPDAISFNVPAAFGASVTFDAADTDGELDFFIADTFPPLAALPGGTLATLQLAPTCQPIDASILAPVNFSADPLASLGDTSGQSVPGVTVDGSVEILVVPPGDCNGDQVVDAGDIAAIVLEIFDGDGNLPADTPNGSFPGNLTGSDPNQDGVVDAGDISCTVLIIFNGPGACGGGATVAHQDGLSEMPEQAYPLSLNSGPEL